VEKSPGLFMLLENFWGVFRTQLRKFARERRGNVAMIFALALIPITIAAGAGLDLSRALMVRARLAEALDAAGLAVGATQNLNSDQITQLANAYFAANYTADPSFGAMPIVAVVPGDGSVTLTTNVSMPTTLMHVVGIKNLTVGYSSKVVWGQTRLWVSLVLDNTGSMSETDKTGTSKISALRTAATNLLTTLKGAANTPGDVKVAIIPFSKTVNVGNTSTTLTASWIDWSDWEAAPPSSAPSSDIGPGSDCPYSTNQSPYGYGCQLTPDNGSATTSTIPFVAAWSSSTAYNKGDLVSYNSSYYVAAKSGTNKKPSGSSSYWNSQSQIYSGYICPTADNGKYNDGRSGHYYNGCYDSVPSSKTTTKTCTQKDGGSTNCKTTTSSGTYSGSTQPTVSTSCSGSGWNQTCTTTTVTVTGAPYSHTWKVNSHSSWSGCIEDRKQDYDIANTAASGGDTNFPAENSSSCVPSVMMGQLSYDWDALNTEVSNMAAGGSTNQTIGLAWGWQAQSNVSPLNSGSLPNNTSQYIILLSDGLNTQDRWYGNGSSTNTDDTKAIDDRMAKLCTAAKAGGMTIYSIFVDLNGTTGDSTVLKNCASDSSKYFDLTTSGAIITTLNNIAQQITQLRVAQ
jgi:Flp pilus assembly protein TadG